MAFPVELAMAITIPPSVAFVVGCVTHGKTWGKGSGIEPDTTQQLPVYCVDHKALIDKVDTIVECLNKIDKRSEGDHETLVILNTQFGDYVREIKNRIRTEENRRFRTDPTMNT